MRIRTAALLMTLFTLTAAPAVHAAPADPYQWCAVYGGSPGDGINCYFLSWEQCRSAISGQNNAFCSRNLFYTGAYGAGPARSHRH